MIEISRLRFRYPKSDFELAIDSLKIETGEKVAFVGPSGSGKTTLLNLIAGICEPDEGLLVVDGIPVGELGDAARRNFRVSNIGLVFQQFELLDYLTAFDNVLVPYWINATLELNAEVLQRANSLARSMGLESKLHRLPAKLSQGEQQRVAICRSLITQPGLLLADEPTGNLDPANKTKILQLLFAQATANQQTLLVVTHDMGILAEFDRTIDFAKLRFDRTNDSSDNALDGTVSEALS